MSQCDLWVTNDTNISTEKSKLTPYLPVTPVQTASSVLTFFIPGTSEAVAGADTELSLSFRIVGSDMKALDAKAASDAATVNYPLHAFFSQGDLSLGTTLVSQSSMTYPERAVIETLLSYDKPAKDTHMAMRMWHKDTAGHMDAYTGADNKGLKKRRDRTANSKTVKLRGPLHFDFLTNQGKLILPNTDITIKLTRSKDSYALMSTAKNERIEILDATLWVRKVTLSPSVSLAHAQTLEKTAARYPFTRTSLKTVTIPGGLRDKSIPNVHMGQVPKRVTIAFVSNIAHNGSYHHNPFNFQHFDLNYMTLFVDCEQYPAIPFTPDFANDIWTDEYNSTFADTGIKFKDEGHDISYDEYGKGYTLYCFDLTPDMSAHEPHWNLQKQGVVRLELRFANPLPEAINCIIYSEFDNLLEIDKNRTVVVDYNV